MDQSPRRPECNCPKDTQNYFLLQQIHTKETNRDHEHNGFETIPKGQSVVLRVEQSIRGGFWQHTDEKPWKKHFAPIDGCQIFRGWYSELPLGWFRSFLFCWNLVLVPSWHRSSGLWKTLLWGAMEGFIPKSIPSHWKCLAMCEWDVQQIEWLDSDHHGLWTFRSKSVQERSGNPWVVERGAD